MAQDGTPARPPWRSSLGPAALLGFLAAGLTGLALAPPYDPADAHGSTEAMQGFAAWMRGAHAWLASAVVVLGVLALGDAWARNRRAARAPLAWYVRVAALGLALDAVLLGGLLRGDQHAAESLAHVAAAARPFGVDPSGWPVRWFWLAHLVGVPLVALALLAAHVGRAWRERFAAGLVALRGALPLGGAVVVLALALGHLLPPDLGPRPIEGVAVSRPAWPFLWLVPLEAWWGSAAGILVGLGGLAVLLIAAPWLARDWARSAREVAVLVLLSVLVLLGARGAA